MFPDFSHEPWIIAPLIRLSNVRSYFVVTFGEGARKNDQATKSKNRALLLMLDQWQNSELQLDNIWWSRDNTLKLCLMGCIINILHHANAGPSALEFKRLSTLDDSSLAKELKLKGLPKSVRGKNGRKDKFKKCLWLLGVRFNCGHTKLLNIVQFRSLTVLVDRFTPFKFTVVVLIETTKSKYNHVVGVWKNMIIYFEEKKALNFLNLY